MYLVEEAKKLWQSLRDPFRKLEMTRCGGAGGDKKSGSAGMALSKKSLLELIMTKCHFYNPTSIQKSKFPLSIYKLMFNI